MGKILVINLGDRNDILESSSFLLSLEASEKKSISLLIFKEFESAGEVLTYVGDVVTIDRDIIKSLFSNSVCPKHFPLNSFVKKVREIESKSFDTIINYSGCEPATYLAGYFASQAEVIGPFYSSQNLLKYKNKWEIVLKGIHRALPWPCFSRNEIYQKMLGLSSSSSRPAWSITQKKHDQNAYLNLKKLKETNRFEGKRPRIVGIRLLDGKSSKAIPLETLIALLKDMGKDKTLLPLLIIDIDKKEKALSDMLNKHFNGVFAIAEADLVAAPSLLKNIDLLVTPYNPFKYLANMVGTPVLEISLGDAPFFSQDGHNLRDMILTVAPDKRWIYQKNTDTILSKENLCIKSQDILKSVYYRLGDQEASHMNFSPDVSVYEIKFVNKEVVYRRVDAEKNDPLVFLRTIARELISSMISSRPLNNKIINGAVHYADYQDLDRWIIDEIKSTTEVTKQLLSTIRFAIQCQQDMDRIDEFVYSLDLLFSSCEEKGLIKIITVFLREKIENLEKTNTEDDLSAVIENLYMMKNHLRKYHNVLKQIQKSQKRSFLAKKDRKRPEANP